MESELFSQVTPRTERNANPSAARPRRGIRRGIRFSLRSLLLLMTACCLGLGVWTTYVQPYRNQAAALLLVSQCQGTASVEVDTGPNWHRWLVVSFLGEDKFVQVLAVDLRETNPSEELLRSLGNLRHLRNLYLDRTDMDDTLLRGLTPLKQLRTLSLRYTPITGQGVTSLVELPQLEALVLSGTKLSDADVSSLGKCTELRELYIRWTGMTISGVEQLREALPACEIHHHELATAQRE